MTWCLKQQSSSKYKGADTEERVVMGIIEDAGNKGIWNRDIRTKSNLNQTALNKILKALEGKKLIKSVSSVSVWSKSCCGINVTLLNVYSFLGWQEEGLHAF